MKELEDYSWFPPALRNFQTEFIGFVVSTFRVYQPFIRHLRTLALPSQPMTDLCSGSGEPAMTIFRESQLFTHLTLTDKFPNPPASTGDAITYENEMQDVLEMEFRSGRCYTMFNAFHHFTDAEKVQITDRLLASGSMAFFVEILEPRVDCFLKVIFSTTLGALIITPFIRPFSVWRLFFTYIIPVNLLTITYDGIVSVFKSGSLKQYRRLFAGAGEAIQVQRLTTGWTPLIVIRIQPVA